MSELTEPLAAEGGLTDEEIERSLRLSIIHGMLMMIFIASTGGMFIIGYFKQLTPSNLMTGIVMAMPMAAGAMNLVAAYLAEHKGERKRLCVTGCYISMASWMCLIAVPYVSSPSVCIPASLAALALGHLSLGVTTAPWMSWMADLIPEKIRGDFLGKRWAGQMIVMAVFAMVEGGFLDWMGRQHESAQADLRGFSIIFAVGVLFGLVSLQFLQRQHHPRPQHIGGVVNLWRVFLELIRTRGMRPLMLTNVLYMTGFTAAGPFSIVLMREYLELSWLTIGLFNAIHLATVVAGSKFWGRVTDAHGCKPVIVICSLLSIPAPVAWMFVLPTNYVYVILACNVLAGFCAGGIMVSAMSLLFDRIPQKNRSACMAEFSTITMTLSALAPLLGGLIAETAHWSPETIQKLHDVNLSPVKLTFVVSAAAWLVLVFVARFGLHDPKGKRVRHTVGELAARFPLRLPWRPRR